jgi:hypothetical protein
MVLLALNLRSGLRHAFIPNISPALPRLLAPNSQESRISSADQPARRTAAVATRTAALLAAP